MKPRCWSFWWLLGVCGALSVWQSISAAEPIVVLRGVNVIDGTGAPQQQNRDLVLAGPLIKEIVPAGKAVLPADAKIINYEGKIVMPGLISAHAHLGQIDGTRRGPENFTRENIQRQLRQYQAYGVTTVVSLGTNLPLIYKLQAEAQRGKLPGADFLSADYGLGAVKGAPGEMLQNNVDQIERPTEVTAARAAVRAAKQRGTDMIKIWVDSRTQPAIPQEIYTAIIDEAHAVGLRVFVHVFSLEDAKALVRANVDVIAHGIRDLPVDQELIDLMKANKSSYIATLALDEAFFIYADRPTWFASSFFRNALQKDLQEQVDDLAWQQKTLATPTIKAAREAVRMNQRNLVTLFKAGVSVAFGTDSGAFPLRIPGFAEHRELELMVQAGLTPKEAIKIATSDSAKLLHLEDRGSLAAGKRADLLVLDGDPTADISNLQLIHAVWQRGKKVAGPVKEFRP
jgi:imidazolonepropionase-like amidohydrolase